MSLKLESQNIELTALARFSYAAKRWERRSYNSSWLHLYYYGKRKWDISFGNIIQWKSWQSVLTTSNHRPSSLKFNQLHMFIIIWYHSNLTNHIDICIIPVSTSILRVALPDYFLFVFSSFTSIHNHYKYSINMFP